MYSVTSSTACTMDDTEPSGARTGELETLQKRSSKPPPRRSGRGMSYFCTDIESPVRSRSTRMSDALRLRAPSVAGSSGLSGKTSKSGRPTRPERSVRVAARYESLTATMTRLRSMTRYFSGSASKSARKSKGWSEAVPPSVGPPRAGAAAMGRTAGSAARLPSAITTFHRSPRCRSRRPQRDATECDPSSWERVGAAALAPIPSCGSSLPAPPTEHVLCSRLVGVTPPGSWASAAKPQDGNRPATPACRDELYRASRDTGGGPV